MACIFHDNRRIVLSMRYLRNRLFWLTLAVLTTIGFAWTYLGARYALRLGANAPQDSIAQDVAQQIEDGKRPEDLVEGRVDMERSHAPFVIIYDQYGKVVKGNGYLDGSVPQVPIGVLSATKGHKINKVTWQPKDHVRIASVSVQADDNYVLGGRSLWTVEQHIRSFTQWTVGLWVVAMILIFLIYKLFNRKTKNPKATPT